MITGPRETIKRARKLRSEMSKPERVLWSHLRIRPDGLKFRRQHPAGPYILDFYCASLRLAIEVDGWVHDNPETIARDQWRSEFLRSQGIATTRIPAKAILEDVEAVSVRLGQICTERKAAIGNS
ncbi:endonuclease domain-containing protein [Qipengyuania sp. 6B39]|uniref:endonuclease domain-containing protein n=1 Tax=Qipengyuania proteolytica TaxID=2867239 RepID=UPI001C89D746|nr:endonuclease domain-containing protein [Qipengyuania proteolytica]MBX7496241.1 endonuclease domain-containing protein [Qipengyuania proteolytica]